MPTLNAYSTATVQIVTPGDFVNVVASNPGDEMRVSWVSPGSISGQRTVKNTTTAGMDLGPFVDDTVVTLYAVSGAPSYSGGAFVNLQSAVSGAGILLNSWSPDTSIQTAALVLREIREAHAAVKADWTPTHFCDPSATVDGSGTYYSPYQVSQLAAIFTGQKKSVTLGMKRGGVYRGVVSFGQNGVSGVTGDAQNGEYFSIVPYGDHPRLPMFIASQNRRDWVGLSNGVYAIVLNGFANQNAAERDVFQNYTRLLRVTSLAALQASAGGTQFNQYSGGTLTIYIKPYNGETPNLGQIEVGDGDVAFRVVVNASGAQSGNVQIHGLHIEGSRNSALSVVCNSAASGIVVNQCVTGNAGVDYNASIGMDAIIVNGNTDANRLSRLAVTNNYAFNARNNAVELSYVDGAAVEGNKSRNIGGAGLECWNSVSNTKYRFNSVIGDPDNSYRQTLGVVAGCGFWSAGQTDGDAVDAGGTKNVNLECAFNYFQDTARSWKLVSGTGHKIHHNTHYIKNSRNATGLSNYEGGFTTGANTLTLNHSNNLYLSNNTNDGYQFMNLAAASHISGGNNNYYMSPYLTCSLRVAGSTKFALEDWVTAMGGSIDTAAKVGPGLTGTPATWAVQYNQVMLDHAGRPVANSALRGKGMTGLLTVENGVNVPYVRDCEGKPMSLTAPTVGCYA